MALTKQKKNQVVGEIAGLLSTSKMTVVSTYQGTTVKTLQQLRRQARDNGTQVKVVKNRLALKAIQQTDALKDADTSAINDKLKGMLLYAFNEQDEVAPAQALASFAKQNAAAAGGLKFVGAITADGKFLSAEEVKTLADLPGKDVLIGSLITTLLAPVNDTINGLSGNLHALLDGVRDKATA